MKYVVLLLIAVVQVGFAQSGSAVRTPGAENNAATSQAAGIPRGKATRYGLFRGRGAGWTSTDKEAGTGKLIRKPKLEFVKQTDRVPLRKGVYFGYKYWLKIDPDKYRAELRRVLIHPEMTLPDGSKVSRSERTLKKRTTHGIVTALDGYALSEDYELVEGDWTFQLWYEDILLVEQTFTSYRPEETTDAARESSASRAGNGM
jgi:hypothetical protein